MSRLQQAIDNVGQVSNPVENDIYSFLLSESDDNEPIFQKGEKTDFLRNLKAPSQDYSSTFFGDKWRPNEVSYSTSEEDDDSAQFRRLSSEQERTV